MVIKLLMEIYIKIPFTKLVEIETVARLVKNSIFIFLTSSTESALDGAPNHRHNNGTAVVGTAEKSHKHFMENHFYLLPVARGIINNNLSAYHSAH